MSDAVDVTNPVEPSISADDCLDVKLGVFTKNRHSYRLRKNGEQWLVHPVDREAPCGGVLRDWDGFWRGFLLFEDDEAIGLKGWWETRKAAADAIWGTFSGICMWTRDDWRRLKKIANGLPIPSDCLPPIFDEAIQDRWNEGVSTGIFWCRLAEAIGYVKPWRTVYAFEASIPYTFRRMDAYIPNRLIIEQKAFHVDLDHTGRADYPTAISQIRQYLQDLKDLGRNAPWACACNYRQCRIYESDSTDYAQTYEFDLYQTIDRIMLLIWLRHIIAYEPIDKAAQHVYSNLIQRKRTSDRERLKQSDSHSLCA
ncbi:type IIL restriction-modification enzyme MmeI [Bifidobacterium sp. SO1]|uniref:type IIL restriction-modification enzyme MmeI n=1 Tax=Bifidobacterium sp. SO1 TaxID=2809029 RepID=UPI001BDDA02C|nr:type IIL restriction-modification enzyme MmeI [Bifidobacterium sp. SO1]MBT1162207.1 hypothetical protein [Bifidobacterium sp. SO1]